MLYLRLIMSLRMDGLGIAATDKVGNLESIERLANALLVVVFSLILMTKVTALVILMTQFAVFLMESVKLESI